MYYNASKGFISTPGVYQTAELVVSPSSCAYLRLMARNKNNTNANLAVSYGDNVSITTGGSRLLYTAADIDNKFGNGGATNTTGLTGKKIVFLGDSIPHG